MTNYGIKITKPGFDALTETDIKNFVTHSTYNSLKIFMEGYNYMTLSLADHDVYTQIVHNLGYTPIIYYAYRHPETGYWHDTPTRATVSEWPVTYDICGGYTVTSTYANFWIFDTLANPVGGNTNVYYKYIIFVNPEEEDWS
jgi:hypothetical protein